MLSGPVELLVLLLLMALSTSWLDRRMGSVVRDFSFLSTILLVLEVWCLVILVNCLLKPVAIFWGSVSGFVVKVMDLFVWVCELQFDSVLKVDQRICELVLWSQFWASLSFQMFVLCWSISCVISSLSGFRLGS